DPPDSSGAPTGGPPAPGVCGDGVVHDGEACDDGNDVPDDGCDAICAKTAALEWSYAPIDVPFANDLTVGPEGRIVVVGDGIVIALEPDGSEVWRKTMPVESHAFNSVEIDEQGTIYVAGEVGTMHALAPNGDELWNLAMETGFQAIALGHGALYSVDLDAPSDRLIVRRHDRSTGAVQWATQSPEGISTYPYGMAVVGPNIIVAGMALIGLGSPTQPLLAVYDDSGVEQSFTLGADEGRRWTAVTAADDGFVLAGFGPEADIVLSRLDAGLVPQWTVYDEGAFGTQANSVASGAGGDLVIAAHDLAERAGLVRRFDAAGATVWTAVFPEDGGHTQYPNTAAFGPDFIVVLGNAWSGGGPHGMWVRRFALN
ncbi:MAG TPA: PQQ-binding-like beta-propeller repeat protein, partial [Nannocystis sp.]